MCRQSFHCFPLAFGEIAGKTAEHDMNYFRNFSWDVCEATIVNYFGEKPKHISLSNTWKKKNKVCHTGVEVEDVRITQARDFLYDSTKEEIRWHKTWCLPLIKISMNNYQLYGGNLSARIYCVIPGAVRGQFEDVGLKGQTSQPLVNGECSFSKLRFVSTSNLHGGKKFHLIVSVWNESGCILAYISTGITVYSRKDADKKRKKAKDILDLEDKTVDTPFRIFSPSLFDREFVKKVSSISTWYVLFIQDDR